MPSPLPRLLTLDLTGTVFRFRKAPFVLYREIAGNYGVSCDSEDIKRGFFASWSRLNKQYPHFGAKTLGGKNWWLKLVHETMKGRVKSRTLLANLLNSK